MKKQIISLLLLVPVLGLAELNLNKVNTALMGIKSSKEIKFYNADKHLLPTVEQDSKVTFTTLNNADVILFPKTSKSSKALIVNSYQTLKESKDSIGAIYTKKGRTQIVFVKERLLAKGLDLTQALHKYLITECHFNPQCFLQLK